MELKDIGLDFLMLRTYGESPESYKVIDTRDYVYKNAGFRIILASKLYWNYLSWVSSDNRQ